jgi:hypothetical protein
VNVKARSDVIVGSVEIRQCRPAVTYEQRADVLPGGGKCPSLPLSSSADQLVLRTATQGIVDAVRTPDGATLTFHVGIGEVALDSTTNLACDPTHACLLVVELHLSTGYVYWTTPLTFKDDNPITGCGGAASGILSTAASDQMTDAWPAWTVDACSRPGAAKGAPTSATFAGEGPAVQGYTAGMFDLAYTAVGYNADVGLVPSGTSPRPSVATPVALNAGQRHVQRWHRLGEPNRQAIRRRDPRAQPDTQRTPRFDCPDHAARVPLRGRIVVVVHDELLQDAQPE